MSEDERKLRKRTRSDLRSATSTRFNGSPQGFEVSLSRFVPLVIIADALDRDDKHATPTIGAIQIPLAAQLGFGAFGAVAQSDS